MEFTEAATPHSLELEQGLLGAVMVQGEETFNLLPFLAAEHFFDGLHKRLFREISKLISDGKQAVPATLIVKFSKDDPDLERAGGASYLGKLCAIGIAPNHVEEYGRTVLDLAVRRQASQHLIAASAAVGNKSEPLSGILSGVQSDLASIADQDIGGASLLQARMPSDDALAFVEAAFKNPGVLIGAPTGIQALDETIGGLQGGDHIVLAGATSMGKSTLAGIISAGAAKAGGCIAVFTPEMTSAKYMARVQTNVAYRSDAPINYFDALNGKLTRDELQRLVDAHKLISDWDLYINDTTGLTVQDIAAETKRFKQRLERKGKRLDAIVVDHIGKIKFNGPQSTMKTHQVESIAVGLKDLAKALDIAVISVCQLSRALNQRENKRPLLSDLRDSGAIEQEADLVIFVYRPQYYIQDEDHPNTPSGNLARHEHDMEISMAANKLELLIAKNRMGPTDTIHLQLDIKAGAIMEEDTLQ